MRHRLKIAHGESIRYAIVGDVSLVVTEKRNELKNERRSKNIIDEKSLQWELQSMLNGCKYLYGLTFSAS